MAYVQRYNVLIASPSDVASERDQIFRTVAAWNGNADGRIVFVPLLWEKHAIADADQAPQEAINEQLLNRADLLLAVFGSRLGTPTSDYPAGTVEELSRRKGQAAVFFLDSARGDLTGEEEFDQFRKLREFRRDFRGFARTYKGLADLADRVRDQLDGWSKQLDGEDRFPLIARPAPWTCKELLRFLEGQDKPYNLLFFNVELASFRSSDAFAERWDFVKECPYIKRVVFLLPEYKVDRLRRLLHALMNGGHDELLQKFHVCPQKEGSTAGSARDRISSSLAFMLACHGSDVETGEYLPVAELAILSEPFSSANDYQDGNPDIQWDYNYYLSVDADPILSTLRRIWRERYDLSLEVPMLSLVTDPKDEKKINRTLEKLKVQASTVGPSRNEESYRLITQLRAKLFDPNVPSYLLNNIFELLDWNSAFELIFPTNRFYRNMSVKEFVDCLDNSSDLRRRGYELVNSTVPLDMEEIRYTSPVYGNMRFTKIASRVVDPVTEDTCGWIVALNVNHVEHWQVYEDDLKRTNEEQSLISLYALSAERVLGHFPGYTAMIDAHAETLRNARRVLDLGAGPGFLAEKLLTAGVAVTSIDINDSMIEIARRRCSAFPGFSAVKANVEKLHAPNDFYDTTKIGIGRLYDGACMLNLYQWLRDPASVLQRLVRDKLLAPGALITISLLCGKDEIAELFRALNHLKQVEAARKETFDFWGPMDFERFSTVMQQFISRGIAKLSPEVVVGHLAAARYQVVDQRRVAYAIDGQRFEGFPFLIAEAPRE